MLIKFHLAPPLQPSGVVRSRGQHSKSAHFVILVVPVPVREVGYGEIIKKASVRTLDALGLHWMSYCKVIIIVVLMGVGSGEVSDSC